MRVIKILLATFFSSVTLNVLWAAVLGALLLNAEAKRANLPPGATIATDFLGLKLTLFHSPWYWAGVVALVIAGVIFAVRALR